MESQNTNQLLQPSQDQSPVNQSQNPIQDNSSQNTPKVEKIKKLSIQIMIGGLISAAVLSVIAVLAGSFNPTFETALITLLLVMAHSLASLAFVERTSKSKNSNFRFFENAVFFIIVLSFFTSIFGVWSIFSGSFVAKLYGTYFILLFACLHGQMLVETRGKQSNIDTIVNINYALMALVISLILPLIWYTSYSFPSFYFRLLAACGIIDATLTILAVILHRLYIQKHPEAQSAIFSVTTKLDANGDPIQVKAVEQKRHIHPLIWLLGIYIVGQFIVSILFGVLGRF
ncbi:MAG TPA: hypothetical protein VLF63_02800 [Patescibacteria group bacterium]|nr:hypothetical protein [Patescibacteria group bacterium]